MSTRPDADRSITEWLAAEVPDRAPERLLEASRQRIRATRQRRAWWPAWRIPEMNNNTVRMLAVAAAVVVVALLGYQLLIAPNVGGPGPSPSEVPSTQPSANPSETATESTAPAEPVNFTQLEGEGTELDPGVAYVIDFASPVLVTFTVPDEPYGGFASAWFKAQFDWGPWHQTNRAALGVVDVVNLYVDPCSPELGLRDPAVGPTADDLATALGTVPGLTASAPTDASLSGFDGLFVELTGAERGTCVDTPNVWEVTGGGDSLVLPDADGGRHSVWILDVDGRRLVIWAGEDPSFTAQDNLQALIDSIEISPP